MKRTFIILTLLVFVALPTFVVFAQSGGAVRIVPDCKDYCKIADLLVLARSLMDVLLKQLALPLATLSIAIAGFYYLTAAGNQKNVDTAKDILINTLIGLFLAAGAWILVYAAVSALGVRSDLVPLLK